MGKEQEGEFMTRKGEFGVRIQAIGTTTLTPDSKYRDPLL
jgi:hypothetical protein